MNRDTVCIRALSDVVFSNFEPSLARPVQKLIMHWNISCYSVFYLLHVDCGGSCMGVKPETHVCPQCCSLRGAYLGHLVGKVGQFLISTISS